MCVIVSRPLLLALVANASSKVNPGNAHFRRFKRPLAVALAATTKKYLGKRDNELAAPHLSVRRRGSFHPTTAFLLIRGGAKVAPPTPSRGKGGNSRPILGPITRQGYDDAENDKALQKEEFSPQFLDFQSRVGFMKKVRVYQWGDSPFLFSFWLLFS